MTMRAFVAFAALIGLLGLGPRPAAAKNCEDLLVGNAYSCTVVQQEGSLLQRETTPNTVCVSFADDVAPRERDGRLLLSLATAPGDTVPCVCGARGRFSNPKFGEAADVTCLNASGDGTLFLGKATKKGLKKGFVFSAAGDTDSVFECKLDPTCATSSGGCGQSGSKCGGSCPDGSLCLNTGSSDPSCECVDAALACETVTPSCGGGFCAGVNEGCLDNAGGCACEPIVAE